MPAGLVRGVVAKPVNLAKDYLLMQATGDETDYTRDDRYGPVVAAPEDRAPFVAPNHAAKD